MKTLPANAKTLWDLRVSGQTVQDLIVVSSVGRISTSNYAVYVDLTKSPTHYEWRWVRTMAICLCHATEHTLRARDYLYEILRHEPAMDGVRRTNEFSASMWDVDKQDGIDWLYLPPMVLNDEAAHHLGKRHLPEMFLPCPIFSTDKKLWRGMSRAA